MVFQTFGSLSFLHLWLTVRPRNQLLKRETLFTIASIFHNDHIISGHIFFSYYTKENGGTFNLLLTATNPKVNMHKIATCHKLKVV